MKFIAVRRIPIVIAALSSAALLAFLALRDAPRALAALRSTGTAAAGSAAPSPVDGAAYVTSAPYRDGLFQGRLARERRGSGRISAGRWSSQMDRSAYSEGYVEGFGGTGHSDSTGHAR